jgi:hypothetical protein
MPAGQDYASRLREETRRALTQHLGTLKEELRALQANLSASVEQIIERIGSILDVESPAVEAVLSDAAREAAQKEARRRDEEMSLLAHFAYDVRHKETQEEILSSLLDGALRYAPAVALFVTRGEQFQGWSSRGFAQEKAQDLRESALAFSDSPLLRSALDAGAFTTVIDISKEPALSRLLPEGMQGPLHAFPLRAIQRPVAVLLAVTSAERRCDLEPLCILMDLTGLCIENFALKILLETKVAKPPAAPPPLHPEVPEPAPEAVPAAPESQVESVAETFPAAETGVPPAPAAFVTEAVAEAPLPPELPVEARLEEEAELQAGPAVLPAAAAQGPESAGVLEAPEEIAAAPTPEILDETMLAEEPMLETAEAAEEPHVAEVEEIEPMRRAALREIQPLTEEERLHADAKRFARLLASEIKLYNEQRVQEGRANRDLYTRLKRDIDRSRDMYEKRVSPTVSRQVDYFHDELVRILADNDPSALGNGYPGPRVES